MSIHQFIIYFDQLIDSQCIIAIRIEYSVIIKHLLKTSQVFASLHYIIDDLFCLMLIFILQTIQHNKAKNLEI